jgi:Protein of unknown function (DUF2477)
MAMNPQERAEFVNGYTRVLITAWSSEEFASRLDSDPNSALRECGIELPAGATVELIRTIPEGEHDGSLDVQIEAWERGLQTGHYHLHVPDTPQVNTSELTEGDLDSIAAGDVYACCCCCPCCCCT